MRVVLSWLQELAPVGDDVDALVETMNDLGLAVEDVSVHDEGIPGVVVARVKALRPHPDADRIQLVDVDPGTGETLQVCCGAFNMKEGDLVPLATLGTTMPNGLVIERRKLRGQWSNGMLCSSAELGLDEDAEGIRILPPDLPLGAPLWEAMGRKPEVVLELDLTRNRPDAWSHLGVARDLAGRLGVDLRVPDPAVEPVEATGDLSVVIDAPDGCGRFTAWTVHDVTVGPSPEWMARRLTLAGMRPINNVVDASNYVMLELGQPNHPYDARKLGGRGFRVRRARPDETLVTLDDVERVLDPADLLICDANDTPIGLAGVMGGASTEIDDATTELALEMAWFEPLGIAATVSRTGLRSEASARFERGCDPEVIDLAARRFVELLRLSSPNARLTGVVDVRGDLPARASVPVRTARVNALLSTDLDDAAIASLITPIGFAVSPGPAPGVQTVEIPSWRPDCTTEIDIIEEVARHYGYSRIGKTVPRSPEGGSLSRLQRDRRLVRQVLVGLGLDEAMPLPFLAPDALARAGLDSDGIRIANPLAAEESVLRTSLLPGLLAAIAHNAARRQLGVGLFEIGHVYRRPPAGQQLPDERERIALAIAGAEAPVAVSMLRVLLDALGVTDPELVADEAPGLHPTRTAAVRVADRELGVVGEVDPDVLERWEIPERVAWVDLDFGEIAGLERPERQYRPVSRFPSSEIDLAFVVPDAVPAARVERTLRDAGGALLVDVRLFDVFRDATVLGDGVRSLAFRLRFQAPDRTLVDAEVAEVRARCIAAVEDAHGARLR